MARAAALAGVASLVLAVGVAAATPRDPSGEAALVLPIVSRAQAAESPPEGWCGETAIQEGLLWLGAWVPQRLANRAGRPTHPDLYSPEIPVALTALGVRYSTYAGPRGFAAFARWARGALDAGDPVLAGVKILPTEHPEWGLDHFVLVVGYGDKGLLVDTTWGTRVWASDTRTPGISLANAFYGIRLRGIAAAPRGARAARLTPIAERDGKVTLRVLCAGLPDGSVTRVERRAAAGGAVASSKELRVERGRAETDVTVEADRVAYLSCVAP